MHHPNRPEPRKAWASAAKQGACDGSCGAGYKFLAKLLPWTIQDKVGVKEQVPGRHLLVHQRHHHDGSPYFKVFRSGSWVCPAMAQEAILLPPGGSTIVLIKDQRSNELSAINVTNRGGRSEQHKVAGVTENVSYHFDH